jgi:23S rRNA (cytosine1962-C5)-methyltransferase
MHPPGSNYLLVDFGEGRKLESIDGVLLDRPCQAAENCKKANSRKWQNAHLRFDAREGEGWQGTSSLKSNWRFQWGAIGLQLKPTPFGHIGVFPEQQSNWQWLTDLVQSKSQDSVRCLNLFAYTGASTLALAAAGCQVTHVDASRPTLQWARENAETSGLQSAPVRWIQEDARRFVEREIKRKNYYDIVLLDPPTYGHGPKGQVWDFEHDMEPLLGHCLEVLSETPIAILWTGHSESNLLIDLPRKFASQTSRLGLKKSKVERAELLDWESRPLDCGFRIRWCRAGD